MAWGHRSLLLRAVLLGLVAQLTVADGGADAAADAKAAGGGKSEGLAYEEIQKETVMTGNATTTPNLPPGKVSPVDGWWNSKICSGDYCVYTNRRINGGRGLSVVTLASEFEKLEKNEENLNKAESKFYDPALATEKDLSDGEDAKGITLVAAQNIRRGKKLMTWAPVLIVHEDLFSEVKKKADRARLLEAAVAYLPDPTRVVFERQRYPGLVPREGVKKRTIEEIVTSVDFKINLGFDMHAERHSRHYAHYPELASVHHDCRPNVGYYIDGSYGIRLTVARRTQPGDPLTISYIDPLMPRYKRQAWLRKHKGIKECKCKACSHASPEDQKKHDAKIKEMTGLYDILHNHDSKDVTEKMIDRYIELLTSENLHAFLASGYEYAALNYNYLGYDKKAKKYADLAVQAGLIESGPEGNDVIANRIFASDIKGHYSYQFTLKRRGQVPVNKPKKVEAGEKKDDKKAEKA